MRERSDLTALIKQLQSADPTERAKAIEELAEAGAEAVFAIGPAFNPNNPATARAAEETLRRIAVHASRPGADKERRAVAAELIRLAQPGFPLPARLKALEFLAFVAEGSDAAQIARLLRDPDVHEAARMALECIPGSASERALQEANAMIPAERLASVEQALAHRKTPWKRIGVRR